MKKIIQKSTWWFGTIAVGVILGISIQFVRAWSEPPVGVLPPNGNVSGPLTTGAGNQTKSGGEILLGGGGSLYAGGLVAAPALCIGADCKTAWPTSGGAGDNLGNHTATQVLNMKNFAINNVSAPINGKDAVNKDYVDAAVGGVSSGSAFTYTTGASQYTACPNACDCPTGYGEMSGIPYATAMAAIGAPIMSYACDCACFKL